VNSYVDERYSLEGCSEHEILEFAGLLKGQNEKENIMKNNKYKEAFWNRLVHDLVKNRALYLMILPIVIYYLVFYYYPMYGAQIAFKDFQPALGVEGSPWRGFKHFKNFFNSIYCGRLIGNTLSINLKNLIFGFPAPIILVLFLNEVKNMKFKK